MKHFLLNLALISCTLFTFSLNVGAHPHKAGEMQHGPSLNSYKIDLSFSTNHLEQHQSLSTIKLANKNKAAKIIIGKKQKKNKPPIKNQKTIKQKKEDIN
mgnify:CR=1 FL=1